MQVFKSNFYLIVLIVFFISSCKKETLVIEKVTYENVIYQLDTVNLYQSASEKNRVKNSSQFYSILYMHLYNQSISSSILNNLSVLTLAIGDKQMARELTIRGFLNSPQLLIPDNQEMRSDLGGFIKESFVRFYLRYPTEYELFYIKDLIEGDMDYRPEHLYESMLLSNEYLYY
ncbi:MAG: hypothetical protein EA412_14040 [Chitinophagaceae bacterium]|nr:MAG: hypothetical protein EA412_14040 [Chitinophagaceae bacterium]